MITLKECKVNINIETRTNHEPSPNGVSMNFPSPLDINFEYIKPKKEIEEILLDTHLKARRLYEIVMKLSNFDFEGRILVEKIVEQTELNLKFANIPIPDLEVKDE